VLDEERPRRPWALGALALELGLGLALAASMIFVS